MINYMHVLIIPCVKCVWARTVFLLRGAVHNLYDYKTIVSPPLQVERYHLRPESVCVYIMDMNAI